MNNLPENNSHIDTIHIKDKLEQLGISLDDINLGNFDYIGEYTAKKMRAQNSENWRKVGAFFRPNYERGVLIYSLIKKYNIKSVLEIGFGRGYGTFCAAMAMEETGGGKVTTVDPKMDHDHIRQLKNVFPPTWFDMVTFIETTSNGFLPHLGEDDNYDLVYIDGDHTYNGVKYDWENTKDHFNKFLLFDDYHLPSKVEDNDIECAALINEIEDDSKELIIMDRRMFKDDRGLPDDEIDYGQVLITHESLRK